MNEIERIIDELMIHAKIAHAGETWQPLQDGTIDRAKWRALLRCRVMEAIEHQFKEGLEFSDLGTIVHPPVMFNLIANYNENGEAVTR